MRVAQILVEGASWYERKHHRIDGIGAVPLGEAEIVHVYAPAEFPPSAVRNLRVPYVASGRPKQGLFKRVPEPVAVITFENAPEVVEDAWFETQKHAGGAGGAASRFVVASFARPSVTNAIQQSMARIHRFRDDIDWQLFDVPPQPGDLTGVDVWVDPSTREDDLDGCVAEALVGGLPVVATRTRVNLHRAEKGHNAFLVPANDANELTHAILAALFKQEVGKIKIEGARKTAAKFRPRQRQRALDRIYNDAVN
jgi:hypothetical protein